MDGLANLLTVPEADHEFMTRLFGPRVPDEMTTLLEDAKWVTFASIEDGGVAMYALVNSIIHQGIGGGAIAGWRLYRHGSEFVLSVCRIALPKAEAA